MRKIENKINLKTNEIKKIRNSIYFMIAAVFFYLLQTLTLFANELTVSGNNSVKNNADQFMVDVAGVSDGTIYNDRVNINLSAYCSTNGMSVLLKVRYKNSNSNPEIIENVHKNVHGSKYNTIKQYSEDGIYELTFCVEYGGEIRSEEIVTFAIDTKAPEINIDGVNHGAMYNSKIELSVNVTEQFFEGGIVNVEILNENERGKITKTNPEYICKATNNTNIYSFTDEGKYTVTVSAMDERGNKSSKMVSFIIDLNAPDIEVFNLDTKMNKSEILNKAPTFSIEVSDWMFNGGWADVTLYRKLRNETFEKLTTKKYMLTSDVSRFTLPVTREGIYVLNVCARDALSNETSNNYYFTLDESPPVIAYFSDFNEKYLKEFNLPESVTNYIKDLTDVSYHTYLNEKETRGGNIRKDGKYILQIVAEDEAGNTSEEDIAFIIDNTKPTVIVSGLNTDGEVDKNSNIKLSLFDADDYFETVTVNGEEITLSEMDKAAYIPIINYGEYEITVKASDNANNKIEKTIVTNCKALSKAPNITELSGNIKKLTKSVPENSVNNFSKNLTENISSVICLITTFIIITLVIFAVFTFVDTNKKEC